MFNFQNAMNMIQQLQNPQQILQRMGVPQDCINSPEDTANYLLKSGKVTQEQIDQANQMYQKMFRR